MNKKTSPAVATWRRQQVVDLREAGHTFSKIATATGYHITHVQRIYRQYLKTKSIELNKSTGRPRKHLSREQEVEFLETLKAKQITSSQEIRRLYREKVGHDTGKNALYVMFGRHEWSRKVPRKVHPKQDLAKQEAFKKMAGAAKRSIQKGR